MMKRKSARSPPRPSRRSIRVEKSEWVREPRTQRVFERSKRPTSCRPAYCARRLAACAALKDLIIYDSSEDSGSLAGWRPPPQDLLHHPAARLKAEEGLVCPWCCRRSGRFHTSTLRTQTRQQPITG